MLGVEGGMGLTFLPGLKPMIHHLNWYFKYWICKMKLFWLIFNTESVLWWRTCLDFKHLEEAFGYFGACTLISLSTYTFRKTLYNWGTGETGFDHNPNCHSVYSPPVQSGFLQFCCLLIPNAISKPAKAELPLQLEIFFIKWFNLKCPLLVLHLLVLLSLLLPLSPSTACNQTSLHDRLISIQIFLHMRSFPEHSGLMTSPYGNRLLPYYEIKLGSYSFLSGRISQSYHTFFVLEQFLLPETTVLPTLSKAKLFLSLTFQPTYYYLHEAFADPHPSNNCQSSIISLYASNITSVINHAWNHFFSLYNLPWNMTHIRGEKEGREGDRDWVGLVLS